MENIDIDIDIDKDILENINIDKEILENIAINDILNRLEFGISNRASGMTRVSAYWSVPLVVALCL